jgi:hypothetical protein
VNGSGDSSYSATRPDIVPGRVAPLSIPLGFVGETTNRSGGGFGGPCAPEDQNFETFYMAASGSPWVAQWNFAGADHMDFVEDVSSCIFVCNSCTAGTADPAVVTAQVRTLAAAFFQRHFLGAASADAWLTGAKVPSGVTATKR